MQVAVISSYSLIRIGLFSILSNYKDSDVVCEAVTLDEAFMKLQGNQPHIILMDLDTDYICQLDKIKKYKSSNSKTKFVIIGSQESYKIIFEALQIGIDGYIMDDASSEEIIYAVNQVFNGKKYYDSSLIEKLNTTSIPNINGLLTPREKQILMALGQGLRNKEIAKEFYITEHTVKKHIGQVLAKLKLVDRTQAAIYVHNSHLVNF